MTPAGLLKFGTVYKNLGRSLRASAASSSSITRPSSSMAIWTNRGWYAEKAESAPTYAGASTTTASPGSMKILPTRSRACCPPFVMITSSGEAVTPSSAISPATARRTPGSHAPPQY